MEGGTRNGASMFSGYWLAAIALGSVTGSAIGADHGDSRILYFEPLQLAPASSPGQQKSARSRELQFDAYGRRFTLTLEPNDKLSPLLQSDSSSSDIELYRGQINGVSQSWARISISQGKYQGMVWDGAELYVIEPVAELRSALPANAKVDATATAIFRLKDVEMTPGAASCGTDTKASSLKAADAYSSMVNELKNTPAIMEAAGATRRLEISVLGDSLLMSRFGTEAETRDKILQRLNNVDGIYSSQLGVEISVPSIDIADSLSSTTVPTSLLTELANLRRQSPNLYVRGLTHMFTGRDLDGSTVGIAYMSSVCDRQYGAGLTQAGSPSVWTESLITAHEIGHNFGAPHDGDPEGACASTPTGLFLMSSSINGNDKFSLCSLSIIQPKADSASCITALSNADIAVDASLGSARRPVNSPFAWELTVRNAGGLATSDTRAEITLPAALIIEEAFVSGGTCTSGAGRVMCDLGAIAGGSSAAVELTLRSAVAASYPISVDVSASNESNLANNHGEGTIDTEVPVNLGVSLQAPTSTAAGAAFNAMLSATNSSDTTAGSVTLTLTLPSGVTASSATLVGGSCSMGTGAVTCSLPSLAGGASATGNVGLTASTVGSAELRAHIGSDRLDMVPANDTASATVSVTTAAVTTSQSRSGGGGGGMGTGLLTLLLGALGLKLQRRHRPAGAR